MLSALVREGTCSIDLALVFATAGEELCQLLELEVHILLQDLIRVHCADLYSPSTALAELDGLERLALCLESGVLVAQVHDGLLLCSHPGVRDDDVVTG